MSLDQLAANLHDVMRQADELTPDEQLRLLVYVAERARRSAQRPKWGDLCGMAPDILGGRMHSSGCPVGVAKEATGARRRSTDEAAACLSPP